jgi:DNA-binding NarL/FixJ family response regulator
MRQRSHKGDDNGVILPSIAAALEIQPMELGQDPASALLTQRQRQVALLIAHGLTNREIGGLLGLSVFTVRNEVISIMRRLDARNRSQIGSLIPLERAS